MAEEWQKVTVKKERMLTPAEAAEYLHVSPEQIRILIRKGHLAACNVGIGSKRPLYRIAQQSLDAFLSHRWRPDPATAKKKFKRLAPAPDFFPHLR